MEKVSFQGEAELGYPHELILFASHRTMDVIQGRYRTRVKLFANFLRKVLGEKPVKIDVPDRADVPMRVLEGLTGRGLFSGAVEDFRARLEQLVEAYRKSHSSPALADLSSFVEDGIFLHILSKEQAREPLFTEEDLDGFLGVLGRGGDGLRAVIAAIRLLEGKSCESVSNDVVSGLSSSGRERLLETAIYVSYALAVRCSRSKRELLVVHYRLVRKAVGELSVAVDGANLADDVFERLFRVAIALFMCGYLKSIRLPQEEKVRYVDEIIKTPSIEQVFAEVFDSAAGFSVPRTDSRVPIWVAPLAAVILLILHATVEIQRPFETSLFGVSIAIPAVPVFLLFALAVLLILLLRLLYLKKDIIKKLRRGTVD